MSPAHHKNLEPPNGFQTQLPHKTRTPAAARHGWDEPPMFIGDGDLPIPSNMIPHQKARRGTTVSPDDSISQAIKRMSERPHPSRRHQVRQATPVPSVKDRPVPPPPSETSSSEEADNEEEPTVVPRRGRQEPRASPPPSKRGRGEGTNRHGIPQLALAREPEDRTAPGARANTMHTKATARGRATSPAAAKGKRKRAPTPSPPSVSHSASHSPSHRHNHAHPPPDLPPPSPFLPAEQRLHPLTTHLSHLQHSLTALQHTNRALVREKATLTRETTELARESADLRRELWRMGRILRDETQKQLRREEAGRRWREKAREMARVWEGIVGLEI